MTLECYGALEIVGVIIIFIIIFIFIFIIIMCWLCMSVCRS